MVHCTCLKELFGQKKNKHKNQSHIYNAKPDGTSPAHLSESIAPDAKEQLQRIVLNNKADFGAVLMQTEIEFSLLIMKVISDAGIIFILLSPL